MYSNNAVLEKITKSSRTEAINVTPFPGFSTCFGSNKKAWISKNAVK